MPHPLDVAGGSAEEENEELSEHRRAQIEWDVIATIANPIFIHRLRLSIRCVQTRYFRIRQRWIPYQEYGYADVVSFLHTIRGLRITRNATNGQYQVEADDEALPFNLAEMYFAGNDEYGNV